ncbi:uncharacterized protein LOC135711648 [Ochlerotatus camptorhynchus]|uniref:uncharacterized protein LOC135711648 n=1 Tax=Ochlerotatus camptorhynchus TaxID=644619 RepID=UPI0031E3F2B4
MDQLRNNLDSESYQQLVAHKVTDQSLRMFEDADLVDIGITAKRPRKIILASIENIRATQLHPGEIECSPEENLRAVLIEDVKFRFVVYNELDQNKVPNEKNLRSMIRILYQQYEKTIFDSKGYPSTNDQWQLAKRIVRVFPQLKSTRINENAPDESAFFWWHSGKVSGDHSGYIFHRVRNIAKSLPKELRKYSRPDLKTRDFIPTLLVQRAANLSELIANSENIAEIKKGMEECFPLHQLLLREKKSVKEILLTLPHLTSYNGLMINDAFFRMNPQVSKQHAMSSILGKGLLLAPGIFRSVEDVQVKGALRIYAKLHRKGVKSSSGEAGPSNGMLAEELLVGALVQWTQDLKHHVDNKYEGPHIVCEAPIFKSGSYRIIFDKVVLSSSESFIDTLDLFWKCFQVFGGRVPIKLQMYHDVFSILIYKTQTNSSRKCVNDICLVLKEAIQAEIQAEES